MTPKPQTVYRVKRKAQQQLETFEEGEKFLIEMQERGEEIHYTLRPIEKNKPERLFRIKKGQFNYAPLVFEETIS